MSSSVEVADGLSAQIRSSLKRLQVACTLPSHETLVDRGQEWLDERQKETEISSDKAFPRTSHERL
jgi:hypothetical protein